MLTFLKGKIALKLLQGLEISIAFIPCKTYFCSPFQQAFIKLKEKPHAWRNW